MRSNESLRAAIAIAAIVAGGTASLITASAHSLNSTMPLCSSSTRGSPATTAAPCTDGPNVLSSTSLLDSAAVSSASDRAVKFMLWAPGSCGTGGASPVFSESDPVGGSASPHNATVVTQGFFVPTSAGVYQWTAELLHGSAVDAGPTACGDEPVTVIRATPAISSTPSAGGPVGTAISDSATVSGGFHPTGSVTFKLFAPADAGCTGAPLHSSTVAVPSSGQLTVTSDTFTSAAAGTYSWVAKFSSGDTNNNSVSSTCGAERVVIAPAAAMHGIASGVSGLSTPGTGSDLLPSLVLGSLLALAGAALVMMGVAARSRPRTC